MKKFTSLSNHSLRFSLLVLTTISGLLGQVNGKLQIHFMDVGQGDGAVLISPQGAVVLFDGGNAKDCGKPTSYISQLGITAIDYAVLSHYHADHFGCATEIFSQAPIKNKAYDRGGSYNSQNYKDWVKATGPKRTQADEAQVLMLDSGSSNPVKITLVAMNGNGVTTTNENDLSLVAVVEYGGLRVEIGGDLSGYKTNSYEDIETSVASLVGEIDVYKVHHHCSAYSTNDSWLAKTKPTIAIVSAGVQNNDYGHPTAECLERLHNAGVKAYWTEEGKGASPDPAFDIIGGNIIVESDASSTPQTYMVRYDEGSATYTVKGPSGIPPTGSATPTTPPAATPPRTTDPKYAWSKNSPVYHLAECRFVHTITADNLRRADTPPANKTLHANCPQP